jgi:hypothetical protein
MSRAIQVSVTHAALGIAVGSVIEILLPKYNDDASLTHQVFETLVQVGLNGAAISSLSSILSEEDPTFGIPFSMALFESQPQLAQRVHSLGETLTSYMGQFLQKKLPLVS